MDECSLYARVLGLVDPWFVEDVRFDEDDSSVVVHVGLDEGIQLSCPKCQQPSPGYDKRPRRWRHLDTCQFKTFVTADVPRVECVNHGCLTISVPWAENRSRFTWLFEALVIDWLQESTVSAVQRRLSMSWSAVDGIMQRGVARGLKRRRRRSLKQLCVDETSFQKRHEYVTVVSTQEGQVLYVADGKGKESLRPFYEGLSAKQLSSIESVSMDLSAAYIQTTLAEVPNADQKIAFDKFHIAQSLTQAVDRVRRRERLTTRELGKSRYLWMKNGKSLGSEEKHHLNALKRVAQQTGRAWSIKEMAMSLWNYSSRGWALKAWKRWYAWAIRSRLPEMKIAARSIKDNLWGIINAIVLNADNGQAESVNSKIKMLKIKARGFRNRERFKTAIMFHCGGLNLYPNPL